MISDTIALAGVYLTLIGLVVSIFLINLTQWVNSVAGLHAKWKVFSASGDRKTKEAHYEQRLEYYANAVELSSPATWISALVATIFITFLIVLLSMISAPANNSDAHVLLVFLRLPCYVFFGLYLIGAIAAVFVGYSRANSVRRAVKGTV